MKFSFLDEVDPFSICLSFTFSLYNSVELKKTLSIGSWDLISSPDEALSICFKENLLGENWIPPEVVQPFPFHTIYTYIKKKEIE